MTDIVKHARLLLFALLSLAYPLAVYLLLGRFEPRWLALLLCALALLLSLIHI